MLLRVPAGTVLLSVPATVTRPPSGCRHVSCEPAWRTNDQPADRRQARTSEYFFAIARHYGPQRTMYAVCEACDPPSALPPSGSCKQLRWAPVDERVSRDAGELGRRFRRSHAHIGIADLLIAATCLSLDAALATMNGRHFPMFESLARPYDG